MQNVLLPAIIGETIYEKERELYSLPVRLGGLGISLVSEKTCNELENSLTITTPLVALIITQGTNLPNGVEIKEATKIITQRKPNNLPTSHQRLKQTWILIQKERSFKQNKRVLLARVLPIEVHRFTLTKNEFRDAVHLRYNKTLKGMPSQCPCGQNYDVSHAMNCKRGGFIMMAHKNV